MIMSLILISLLVPIILMSEILVLLLILMLMIIVISMMSKKRSQGLLTDYGKSSIFCRGKEMSLSCCFSLYYKLPKSDPSVVYQLPTQTLMLFVCSQFISMEIVQHQLDCSFAEQTINTSIKNQRQLVDWHSCCLLYGLCSNKKLTKITKSLCFDLL